MSSAELLLATGLAYYWTGLGVVNFHRDSHPIDRPAYVRGPFYGQILVGLIWPYACWKNEEFGWFACDFFSSLIMTAFSIAVLTIYLSYFWAIIVIGTVRTIPIPIISKAYLWVTTAVFGIIWWIASRFLPIRMPSSIERFNRYREGGG